MITTIFLNIIYLIFPLLFYFMYLVYSEVTYEKEKKIFLDLALFSSFYICSRFGGLIPSIAFFINVPLVLALYKKRILPSLILTFTTACYLSSLYNISLIPFIIQYVVILLLNYFTDYKKQNVFLSVKILFGSYLIFSKIIMLNFQGIYTLLLIWFFMYICFFIIIIVYNKVERLVKMHRSLEDVMREKTLYQSLFKITHEIKNPLAVCKGYLEMFDIRNVGKANKYVSIIDQEIDRTLELLKDFSDVSKLDINKNLMSVNMLIEDVCDEAKMILKNNIEFKYNISSKDVTINADYNRLKQVLINVIKNAKESIKDEGTVTLETKLQKKFYVITVVDDGIGMDKETLNKIGTAFFTTKKNGTGLGVCFSKEIIEKHNASIKYYSKEYIGTKVVIKLPI